jgi:hypothetical protein
VQRTRVLLSAGAFAAATMSAVMFASSAGAWDHDNETPTTMTTMAPGSTMAPESTMAPTTVTTAPTGGGEVEMTTTSTVPTGGGAPVAVAVVAKPKLTG